jgi:ABC-type lipoprotein release transport system permease subunit
MKSIIRLTLANIKRGKGAFSGIILLMALITFTFSGTVSNDDQLRSALSSSLDEADVGELTVFIYDDLLTEDMLDSLGKNGKVKSFTQKSSMIVNQKPVVGGKEQDIAIQLKGFYNGIKVFNSDFDSFTADTDLESGSIYLPYKLEAMEEMKKGAEISFTTSSGSEETFIVRGFYEDPVHGATTIADNQCIISAEDFKRLCSHELDHLDSDVKRLILQDELYIHGEEGVSAAELKRSLINKSGIINSSNWAVSRQHIMDLFEMYSNTDTRGMAAFTIMLLLVILITMHNSISASIEMDSTDLGILRSQGFTVGRIRLVYVFQYTIALIIGSILGILISIPACRILIRMWMRVTGILTGNGVSFGKCIIMCLAIILICLGFIVTATRKVDRISPVRAISGGRTEVHFDSRLNTKIRQKPLSLSLALRQLNSRRRSYIGTFLIVVLLVFFLVSIMLLVENLDPDKLFGTSKGQVQLISTGAFTMESSDEIEAAARETDPKAELYTMSYHRMVIDGEFTPVHSFRRTEDYYDIMEGRAPKYDNEIIITKGVSEDTGKKTGDTVTVSYQDRSEEFVVTGYFQSVYDFGLVTMMTEEGMQKMGYNDIQEAQISLSDDSKIDDMINMLNDRFGDRLSASEYVENNSLSTYRTIVSVLMNSVTYAMYAVITIFAAVVVVMVSRRAFIKERTDIGIFKAMGFTAGSLRRQFAMRFAAVALAGTVVGEIFSALWARKMISFMMKIVGLTDFKACLTPAVLLMPAAVICLSFFIVAYLASGKIKRIEVRELITE